SMDGSETEVRGGSVGAGAPQLSGERVLARPLAPVFPAGQDAAFARPFAERFRTAAGLVAGLRDAVAAHLRQAKAHRPRPPVALIAGGRPSQARALQARGTVTYLHVPSPGLLDLFLKDGARQFVFEGRECGGHVGPRTSFVLWEAQVERLLAFEAPEELS